MNEKDKIARIEQMLLRVALLILLLLALLKVLVPEFIAVQESFRGKTAIHTQAQLS